MKLTLYSSPISDASARVRIALRLKGLTYETITLYLSKGETETSEFALINPAQTLPTLVIAVSEGESPACNRTLTQSNAILEYLDEAFPSPARLLPPLEQPLDRADVRSLVGIIATDIHPLTTPRVGREISSRFLGGDSVVARDGTRSWRKFWIMRGLNLYETMAAKMAGRYSFGDAVSMADVYLIPELWTAVRFGVDLDEFPTISRIYGNLMLVEAVFREAHQPHLEGL